MVKFINIDDDVYNSDSIAVIELLKVKYRDKTGEIYLTSSGLGNRLTYTEGTNTKALEDITNHLTGFVDVIINDSDIESANLRKVIVNTSKILKIEPIETIVRKRLHRETGRNLSYNILFMSMDNTEPLKYAISHRMYIALTKHLWLI